MIQRSSETYRYSLHSVRMVMTPLIKCMALLLWPVFRKQEIKYVGTILTTISINGDDIYDVARLLRRRSQIRPTAGEIRPGSSLVSYDYISYSLLVMSAII